MRRPRVLLAITVYNGRDFVGRCLHSARNLQLPQADLDVLVLDDCSPEPGFSHATETLCKTLGFRYYRSPANLGIVRNMNLGMLAALHGDYTEVVLSNSDVVYATHCLENLYAAATTDAKIGSVTAWSNDVSIYSLANHQPQRFLSNQHGVDWVAQCLQHDYAALAMDIPVGVGFMMLIPTEVISRVGLMDPIFGRGYCEESDWCLRSLAAGYRITLAPAAFAYHQGRGSSIAAGICPDHLTTVPANEAIIDYRYPLFRAQMRRFLDSGQLANLQSHALQAIMRNALRQFGYQLHVAQAYEPQAASSERVCLNWSPATPHTIQLSYKGFQQSLSLQDKTRLDSLLAILTATDALPQNRPLLDVVENFMHTQLPAPLLVHNRRNGVLAQRAHATGLGQVMYPAYV